MTTMHSPDPEILAELTAYRSIYLFLLKALQASAAGLGEPTRSLFIEQIETQLKVRQGELLYTAPPEMAKETQALSNAVFQQTFKDLSKEIVERLATPKA